MLLYQGLSGIEIGEAHLWFNSSLWNLRVCRSRTWAKSN